MNLMDDDGRKTGPWEEPDPNGGISKGHYMGGERSGIWRHYFRDGALRSEAHYEHGELNGACIWYRQTGGLLQKGGFLSGEKHGLWKRWTKDGVPIDEGTFDRGVKSGEWTYYAPDGTVKKTTNHRGRA